MIRTQIYLTKKERQALQGIAKLKGTTQSDVIREAIDEFIAAYRESDRVAMLRAARGIWADRETVACRRDLRTMRDEFDRTFGEEP
jgi:hypothetical protein